MYVVPVAAAVVGQQTAGQGIERGPVIPGGPQELAVRWMLPREVPLDRAVVPNHVAGHAVIIGNTGQHRPLGRPGCRGCFPQARYECPQRTPCRRDEPLPLLATPADVPRRPGQASPAPSGPRGRRVGDAGAVVHLQLGRLTQG